MVAGAERARVSAVDLMALDFDLEPPVATRRAGPALPALAGGWFVCAHLHRSRQRKVAVVPGNGNRWPVANVNGPQLPPLAFGCPIGQYQPYPALLSPAIRLRGDERARARNLRGSDRCESGRRLLIPSGYLWFVRAHFRNGADRGQIGVVSALCDHPRVRRIGGIPNISATIMSCSSRSVCTISCVNWSTLLERGGDIDITSASKLRY
jgi:hypothetical protein